MKIDNKINYKIIIKYIIIGIVFLLSIFIITRNLQNKNEIKNNEYLYKIDSLNKLIINYQLQNDSLLTTIKESKDSIIYIEKWYEKDINYINSATVSEDIEYFSKYLLSKDNNK
jgi:hypothetical protein